MSNLPPHLWGFETSDPDLFASRMSPVAPGVEVGACSGRSFFARAKAVRLPRVGLFSVDIVDGRVLSAENRGWFSVSAPVSGTFEIAERDTLVRFCPGTAHVLDNVVPFDLRVQSRAHVMVASFDLQLIETHAQQFPEQRGVADLHSFLSLETVAGSTFWRQFTLIWNDLNRDSSWMRVNHIVREVESILADFFILARGEVCPSGPGPFQEADRNAVGRAVDYIHAHLRDDVSLSALAATALVSPRSLQRGFKSRFGMTPLQYLRQRRIEAANRELLGADPDCTRVIDVAYRYGFRHLGRFSGQYRAAIGEHPSETLNRAR